MSQQKRGTLHRVPRSTHPRLTPLSLPARPLDSVASILSKKPGDHVRFRARVHHIRPLGECPHHHPDLPGDPENAVTHPQHVRSGSKILFLILRQQLATVQAVVTEEEGKISPNMVRWAEGINREAIVIVEGLVQTPPENQSEVKSTSIHKYEVKVQKVRPSSSVPMSPYTRSPRPSQIHVVASPTATLPFQVDDISRPVTLDSFHHVGDKTRFNNRVLDLRVRTCILRLSHRSNNPLRRLRPLKPSSASIPQSALSSARLSSHAISSRSSPPNSKSPVQNRVQPSSRSITSGVRRS